MQTAALSTAPRIPFGTPIVYSNQWTGFTAGDCFEGQFKNLSVEEVSSLKAGDTIFVDVDPMHLHGKVYGYFKGKVTDIRTVNDYVFVGFECGDGPKGRKRIQLDNTYTPFFVVANEEKLAATLEKFPLASIIYNID